MSIKKALLILAIILAIGTVVVFVVVGQKTNTVYTTVPAEKGSIIQTVSETGTVKSDSGINLSFLNTGRIKEIIFKVGDTFSAGDKLAELDYDGLAIKREELSANLAVAQESLNKLLAGATYEEIAVAKANVERTKGAHEAAERELDKTKAVNTEKLNQAQKRLKDLELKTPADVTVEEQAITSAQTNLNNTIITEQKNIDNSIESARVSSEDKIVVARTALDAIRRVLSDEDADDLLGKENPAYLNATEATYSEAGGLITAAEASLVQALTDKSSSTTLLAVKDALLALDKVSASLQNCFKTLENSITSSDFTQAELDAFKTSISVEQTTISTAINTIKTKEQNLNDAVISYETTVASKEDLLAQANAAFDKALSDSINALANARLSYDQLVTADESRVNSSLETWQVSQAELNRIEASSNKYDLALARARVRQAQAALSAVDRQIEDSRIIAPLDGIITKADYEVGEQVAAGQTVVSILGKNGFEIEVLISEADVAKIKLSDKAEITLDAFGEDIKFLGQVYFVEPAETVIQDVIYYKVKLAFDPQEHAVKSGMTANIVITTSEKNDILVIPGRAVIDKNGAGKYVRLLVNNNIIETQVITGLRGDGGMVEVLSGIQPGDMVVTQVKEN